MRVLGRKFRLKATLVTVTSVALYLIAVASAAGPITINDPPECTTGPCTSANASPYPSTITVSGSAGISSIRVFINGFWHDAPNDVDMMLGSPSGQSVMLMSDAGDTAAISQGSPIDFSFADDGEKLPSDDPGNPNGSTLQTNHKYKPADYDTSPDALNECVLFGPGDAGDTLGGSVTTLAGLGTTANGTWNLYVVDDCGESGTGGGGEIASWCLLINNVSQGCTPTAATVTGFAAKRTAGAARVVWRTTQESAVAGFDVYRSQAGRIVKVNRTVVHAKHPGTSRGASYAIVDRGVKRATRATYRLEIVKLDGSRTSGGVVTLRSLR